MDDLAHHNRARWNALAQARNEYTRPHLDWDAARARAWYASHTRHVHGGAPDPAGKDVLCLASGGGQQSAAFALMGANVTVFDLSDEQLARDRETAVHYGHTIRTVHGDMRDLSALAAGSFDIVWQPYSINFVDDAPAVIRGVGRVIRPGGFYHLHFGNPFWTVEEREWNDGYPLRQPYETGARLAFISSVWEFEDDAGNAHRVEGPHEFVHTLGAIFNALVQAGFVLGGFREEIFGDETAVPGTWEHLSAILPPFFNVAAWYRPEVWAVSRGP